ncbi:MAG: aminotransferase class III-fold pyridoxal phosphate-dependent enzyme [Paracoccaceae bacterium]
MTQLRPFTDPLANAAPRRIVSGDGIRVRDADGAEFVDAVSGLWCAALGFAPRRLADAAAAQMRGLAYYHGFMGRTHDPAERLSQRLSARLPGALSHLLYATSGSEAVETAVKVARYAQGARGHAGRTRVIAREGGYHGSGQLSAALTSMSYCHDGFDLPHSAVIRVAKPSHLHGAEPGESERDFSRRLAAELDATIRAEDPGTIAAFIGEPAIGSGGVILPPDGYWAEVQEVLSRHSILLIADEIITGFGRTGRWFGCQTWGISPDLMTMAKQMTAAVFPMSAVAMTEDVHRDVARLAHELGSFGHGVTYGGHPVGAAVALECLAIYEEMDLEATAARLGDRIGARLGDIAAMPGVRDTRRAGLIAAVEMQPGLGAAVGAEAEARGVLFRIIGDTLAIAPPYVATEADIDHIMDVMTEAVRAAGTGGLGP